MYGEAAVPKMFKGEKITITVDKKKACIDLVDLSVQCEDSKLKSTVQVSGMMRV
jgi:Pre-mRNA 3''-end-processing endonuclease polyadenylation factor C-term.